jgi:hypothetical protein
MNWFEPDEEKQAAWADWVSQRPPHVRAVAERFFPWKCYRLKDTRGHYVVLSFSENDEGRVTLRLAHGLDSSLPGVQVFGIDPADVAECGCGHWEWPTEAQAVATNDRIMRQSAHLRN